MKHRIADLLDIPRLQALLDRLYNSSKIPSAVIDVEGNVHTRSGWQDICTKFHRVHPSAGEWCVGSDIRIRRRNLEADPCTFHQSPHGLVDSAIPIIIGGEHLGNVFSGLVFLEEPDLDSFRSQARTCGFDEEEYIEAVKKVPIVSEQALRENVSFLAEFTGMIAEMGVKRARELEAVRRLEESEVRYGTLFRENRSVMLLVDPASGRIEDVNPAAVAFYGYPEEVLRTMMIGRINAIPEEETVSFLEQAFHETADRFVIPQRLASGVIRSVAVHTSPVEVGGRNLLFSFNRDITERMRVEEELKEATRRLRLATTSGGIGIWDWDLQSNMVIWDERVSDIYGFPEGKSPGRVEAWKERLHPEDYAGVMEAVHSAILGEKEFATEFRVVHADGMVRVVQANAIVLWDAGGKAVRMIGMNRDITVQRTLENRLFQAQKLDTVGRLAGGIAHDFNNLLTAIIGSCDLALNEVGDADSLRRDMYEIRIASEKCASLTRQMLAFSRRQIMAPKAANLNDTVAEMCKLLRRVIGENIELETRLEEDLGTAMVDPAQFELVILTLAMNARDAMPEGGNLVFETRNVELDEDFTRAHTDASPGPHVMLSVGDTGCGMNAEVLSHVFEPFYTTKEKGTGLGLSSVYGIVKQFGGCISAHSEPGIGTTFKMCFPRVEGPAEKEERQSGPRPEELRGNETILLMEDESLTGRVVRAVLEQNGYGVIQARCDDEAIELCERFRGRFHLLLTDVIMPGMGGKKLSRKLMALQPGMKALFMSGYPGDVIEKQGILVPDVDFLQKPFSMVSLLRKVRDVLESKPHLH